MSIFSKIKQFFSNTSRVHDDAEIIAPYKVEMPVITEAAKPLAAAITAKKKAATRLPKAKPAVTPAKKSRKPKPKSE